MSKIEIRQYQDADWPRLSEIHDSARMMELASAGLTDAFIPLAEAAENEALFEYELRVAEADGVAAGFAAYTEDELAWLYVAPEYMRRGIGRTLVCYVVQHTQARPLCIEVLCGNEPAKRLYESCGFVVKEVASGKMPGNEQFQVSAYCMELS